MDQSGDFDFRSFVTTLRRRFFWVLASLLVTVSAANIWIARQEPIYHASALVVVQPSAAEQLIQPISRNPSLAEREIGNAVRLALSDPVERQVEAQLGFVPTVEVNGSSDADVIEFRAESSSAEGAAAAANAWAQVYITVERTNARASIDAASEDLRRRLTELREERRIVRASLDVLDDTIAVTSDAAELTTLAAQRERLLSDLGPELEVIAVEETSIVTSLTQLQLGSRLVMQGTADVLELALPPLEASGSSVGRSIAISIVIGLVVGVGLALMRDATDDRILTAEDLQAATRLPVLASVPRAARRASGRRDLGVAVLQNSNTPMAESFHKLRSAIQFASTEGEMGAILITSAMPSDGKSTTASNLAWALASAGHRSVLVDADLRRPQVHAIFGVSNERGTTDCLATGAHPGKYTIRVDSQDGDLVILPSGKPRGNPAEMMASKDVSGLLGALQRSADVIIVDSPPVLPVSDALSLLTHVDSVVFVVRVGKSKVAEVSEAVSALRRRGANVIGTVLVGTAIRSDQAYYDSKRAGKHQDRRPVVMIPVSDRSNGTEKRTGNVANQRS